MATIREGSITKAIYGMIRDQQYMEAIQILSYQLQMFPRSRAALSLLAYCYYHIQDFVQAVTQYELLVKYFPYVTEYKIYYAQSLFKAGIAPILLFLLPMSLLPIFYFCASYDIC